MLTGDDAADERELVRLIAHEERVLAREIERGYLTMAQVAIASKGRYVRLLDELRAKMAKHDVT